VGEAKRRKLAGSYPTPTDASVDPMSIPQEPEHPLVLALQAAKTGDEVTLAEALAIIDRMPDVIRERLLSAFAAFRKFDDAP
jgi:hypothetical protein